MCSGKQSNMVIFPSPMDGIEVTAYVDFATARLVTWRYRRHDRLD
jgi:hypothetical protein